MVEKKVLGEALLDAARHQYVGTATVVKSVCGYWHTARVICYINHRWLSYKACSYRAIYFMKD